MAERSRRHRLTRVAVIVAVALLSLAAAVLLGWVSFPGAKIITGTLLVLGELVIIYAYLKGILH